MFSPVSAAQKTPNVTAIFKDGAQSFLMPEGATLGELAVLIDALGSRYDDTPISIHVHFESAINRLQPVTQSH